MVDHLEGVADLARRLAEPFGGGDVAYYAGLWHDLGKFSPAFQEYLRRCEERPERRHATVDHKAAGAMVALDHQPLVSLLIHAHHGGLRSRSDLKDFLSAHRGTPRVAEATEAAREAGIELDPADPIRIPESVSDELATDLFIRLTYSALVDADSLDTEAHFAPDRVAVRTPTSRPADLLEPFLEGRERLLSDRPSSPVDLVRREVFESCLTAAEEPPGLFRLTVPTGGGKTLSGMVFALRHAQLHGLERVIVAVPYISITQQTAAVYREVLGTEGIVLEHHSRTGELDGDEGEQDRKAVWARLASENWDVPVVVTTTVQLFESLFSNRRGRLRKVHRLARSVIVLDEAQALPLKLVEPILDALQSLSRSYGTSVVLSTATQPAFEVIPAFRDLSAPEIVPEHSRHFQALKRVTYSWEGRPVEWSEAASWMLAQPRCLAIVNTKPQALEVMDALGEADGTLHLSTLLCGAHRRAVIEEVRERLRDGSPVRLVSTQVVEAGVDFDFPVVFRAIAPADSIVQAAGRCNREGLMETREVVVFRPADQGMPPASDYRVGAQVATNLLERDRDLADPSVLEEYFRSFLDLMSADVDRHRIQDKRGALDFPRVEQLFRMIEDDTVEVVVPYGDPAERRRVEEALSALRKGTPGARHLLRRLGPYTVSLRRHQAEEAQRRGLIAEVMDGLGEWLGPYHPVRGLVTEGFSPAELVV